MFARDIKLILAEILQYENSEAIDPVFEPRRLASLAKAYVEMGDIRQDNKNQQKEYYGKALNCFNEAISLDKKDYDPSMVADRSDLLLKIIKNGMTIKDPKDESLDAYKQLQADKILLEAGIDKLKGVKKIYVRNTIEHIVKLFRSTEETKKATNEPSNNFDTNSIMRKLEQIEKKIEQACEKNVNSKTTENVDEFKSMTHEQLRNKISELIEENKNLKRLTTSLLEENNKLKNQQIPSIESYEAPTVRPNINF